MTSYFPVLLQGLPLSTLSNFIDILSLVGSSAAKGSIFMGELPASLAGTEFETRVGFFARLFIYIFPDYLNASIVQSRLLGIVSLSSCRMRDMNG